MIKAKWILLMLIMFCTTAYGAETKPSDESIKELLRVTESRNLVDSMMGQMDNLFKSSMQQALQGKTITQKEQKLADDMQKKMNVIFKEEMSWEMLEPLFMQIYRDSFTQQEVDGMLAFYKSPSGQSVIRKMPLVMQNTMTEMQKRMGPIYQKLSKMTEETITEMKASDPGK